MNKLRAALQQMERTYLNLLLGSEDPIDRYNIEKALLDAQWQAEMLPVISDLYWHPLRGGVDDAPEDDEDLREWINEKYRDAVIVAVLLLLLQKYHLRGANLGGQTSINVLGLPGSFQLSNADYLQELRDRAGELVGTGTEFSVIDTTVDDLVVEIPKAKAAETNTMLALGAYIATRAPVRTEIIERTERPWSVANGMLWSHQNNGIRYIMYDINGIGCPKICHPDHGLIFPINRRDRHIPRHPRCDCIWTPVRYNGQIAGYPPVTVSIPDFPPWTPPAIPWLGGNIVTGG
jgi:hypothetical protein